MVGLAMDLASVEQDAMARRAFYKAPSPSPLVSVIPNTVLIDQDLKFVQAFSMLAGTFRVPFRSFRNVGGLQVDRRWNYGLVLVDEATVGREYVIDTALRLRNERNNLAIIVIGENEPSKEEMRNWWPLVKRFLRKDSGVEAIFNDAMQVYSTQTRRQTKFQDYMR